MTVRLLSSYYKIIIIGAGPAGLAAADELLKLGISGSDILIIDMGPDIGVRQRYRKMGSEIYNVSGLGGAGLFSDGKLSLAVDMQGVFSKKPGIIKRLGGPPNPHISADDTKDLFEYASTLFTGNGIRILETKVPKASIPSMYSLFENVGVYFRYREVKQVDPSCLPQVIYVLKSRLESSGVTILLETKVLETIFEDTNFNKYLKCETNHEITTLQCQFLIFAVGKAGIKWLINQTEQLKINKAFRPLEIGVRIEVPNRVLSPFTRNFPDLKLIRNVNDFILSKTFCVCTGGIILPCKYNDLLILGGYTTQKKSANTNFALMVNMNIDTCNPLEFGFSVVRTCNILGQGKPLIQRLGDMKNGIASTQSNITNNSIKTTLSSYTPGNIALALPQLIVDTILDTLTIFERAIPGINNDSNVISAPCLEYCYERFQVNQYMETNKKGIYVVGDVAGYAKGIIQAAASGILAARGIASQTNFEM
jgi:uncharacterized FAD-dependent dehydrogenase